jgi:hypothetical protein
MIMRIFVGLVILVAIVVGALVLYVPRDLLVKIIYFRDFFDAALPILAFGALIKYLCTCCMKCESCHTDKPKV